MKRIVIFALALCLMVSMAIPALAVTREEPIVELKKSRGIVIGVQWDVERPDLVFLAPDDTEYSPLVPIEGTSAVFSDNSLYYIIENAAAGQWRVRYDKKGNTTLDISVHNYQQPLVIQSFEVGVPADDKIPVKVLVEGPEGKTYNYRISAMIDHTGVEQKLASGSHRVGSELTKNVSLSDLASYDAYLLKLTVWYEDQGVDVTDFAFSEPFAYDNSKQNWELPEHQVVIRPEDDLLQVRWEKVGWTVDSVMVAVFEDNAQEPEFFDEYDPQKLNQVELGYSPDAQLVRVEVSFRKDDLYSNPVSYEMKPSEFRLELEDTDAVRHLSLPLTYRGMSGEAVNTTVNGYTTVLNPQGDGKLQLTLQDGWNTLDICYTDEKGVTWQLYRQILVDRDPPALTMTRDYDGMRVDHRQLTVSGTVADCAVLTVNAEAVTVTEGSFSKVLELTEGSNHITVVAADALGNESLYTATVTCGNAVISPIQSGETPQGPGALLSILTAQGSYYVAAIAGGLCLLVVLYALIFWKKEGKK